MDDQQAQTAARVGWQASWGAAPRWATARSRDRLTYGPVTADISTQLGKPPFPAQRYVLDILEEVDPDTGRPWYEEVIIIEPRRSGKTVLIAPLVARRCGSTAGHQAWITAQKRESAVRRWKDATTPLAYHRQGRRLVSKGHEEHIWLSGASFTPFAPDEETMHGEDPDTVFIDELWSMTVDQLALIEAGYEAAWSVKPGQAIKLSAAGTHRSTALKAARRRGRAATLDPNSRTAYFEWCLPDTWAGKPVHQVDNEQLLQLILANHPRAGHGLRPDFVAEQITKSRTESLRAYGGLDVDTSELESVIDSNAWRRARTTRDRIPPDARVGFGVAVDGDWREATISAGWRGPDGVALLEVIDSREQTRWAISAIRELLDRWPDSVVALSRDAGGGDIGDTLEREGLGDRLIWVTSSQRAAACHRLQTGIEDRQGPSVLHRGERALHRAVHAASHDRAGRWIPATDQPITALDAHTLALWAADHLPALPDPIPAFRIL